MTRLSLAQGFLTAWMLFAGWMFVVAGVPAVVSGAGPKDSKPAQTKPKPAEDGWISLFNGHDLTGWKQRGGTAKYTVEEGEIVGTTAKGSLNSFLCTDQDFKNFELEFEVKLDSQLNSGVQIRSVVKPDHASGRVQGYQVEISTDGNAGFIYDEARRRWLSNDRSNSSARSAFKDGQWNQVRVACQGSSIRTWINGVAVADLKDNSNAKGFIALQVHAVLGDPHWQVRFRNLRVKPL